MKKRRKARAEQNVKICKKFCVCLWKARTAKKKKKNEEVLCRWLQYFS